MAPGSNLEGAYHSAASSSSYHHYQQPMSIPPSHNEQPAYGMTCAPQVRNFISPVCQLWMLQLFIFSSSFRSNNLNMYL